MAVKNQIKTSDPDWLEKTLNYFVAKVTFVFIDDMNLGIEKPDLESAVKLIKKAKSISAISWREIVVILTGLGLCSVGVWMIAVAIADPDPTSKLWILLAGGVVLAMTGGLSILRALGMGWRVTARRGDESYTVEPR